MMQFWAAAPRPTSGLWGPSWYAPVEASTAFAPPETGPVDLPEQARALADRCRPYYEQLAEHRIHA